MTRNARGRARVFTHSYHRLKFVNFFAHLMIKEKLLKLRSLKKTSDLYTKPLFLLENTENLDIDTHRDMLSTDKYIRRNKLRETYTEQQENKFNKKYGKYLKSLVTKRKEDGFTILVDFHIKFYHIDRYNKNELIFILLPDYLIYGKELAMLGMEPSLSGIVRKMKDKEFYFMVMEYYKYDFLFFKHLMHSFLEGNERLPSFYGLTVLKVIRQTNDHNFLCYVYLSFKSKAKIEIRELDDAMQENGDEKTTMRRYDGNTSARYKSVPGENDRRKNNEVLIRCRNILQLELDENVYAPKARTEIISGEDNLMRNGSDDLIVNLQINKNYSPAITENELTGMLLKKNARGHFIVNCIKIAKNSNYDIVVPLSKIIDTAEDKRTVLEYVMDYHTVRNKIPQVSKIINLLVSHKECINGILRGKLHDFLDKVSNKRSYNSAIEKLYNNGLVDYVRMNMLDSNSGFLLDSNIGELNIANECLQSYRTGNTQPILNGYVIRDWEGTAKKFWQEVLETTDRIPPAMLSTTHLVHLFTVPVKYHKKIALSLAQAINEDNCYDIARAVINRNMDHVEILALVHDYVQNHDLFVDHFCISDEELKIILLEHKNTKAIAMILQLVSNHILQYIPLVVPLLIQEKELLCLVGLIKRYKNVLITYLQQFMELGMDTDVFAYFDNGSTVLKMIDMAAYDTLYNYINVLPCINSNTCQVILHTNNIDLIRLMILRIVHSGKECRDVHYLLKDIKSEDVRELIKENAIKSKILRNVIKEWS